LARANDWKDYVYGDRDDTHRIDIRHMMGAKFMEHGGFPVEWQANLTRFRSDKGCRVFCLELFGRWMMRLGFGLVRQYLILETVLGADFEYGWMVMEEA
jgi:hypothetical protein